MIGIEKELLIFLTAFSSGLFLRGTYRCLECFRDIVKHSFLAVGIEDLFYWIFVEMYLFVQIYHTSSGSVRWYYILGVVVGALFMTGFLKQEEKLYKKIYTYRERICSKRLDSGRKKR